MRILKRHFAQRYALKDLVSEVLTFDYLGPWPFHWPFHFAGAPFGCRTNGVLFGLDECGWAFWCLWLFRTEVRAWRSHVAASVLVIVLLLGAMVGAAPLTSWAEDRFYGEGVVLRQDTPYQRIVVTQGSGEPGCTSMAICSSLRVTSTAITRTLVHPAMAAHGAPRRVLVLGAVMAWPFAKSCVTHPCSR